MDYRERGSHARGVTHTARVKREEEADTRRGKVANKT